MAESRNIEICKRLIRALESKTYFRTALSAYTERFNQISTGLIASGISEVESNKRAYVMILSHLHDIMRNAEPLVEAVISARIESGNIRDASQARKSAAGNIFQQMFAYALAKNVVEGNITVNVIITTSVTNIIEQYAAIRVGEDIQKPDSDVIVYSEDIKNSPIMNFSCKTSCRERAGQTYKWKLLCDLATCRCDHKIGNNNCPATKYKLEYSPIRDIKTCFVTTDFYNELTNPQICAMFNFFDYSYIAKTMTPAANIKSLEYVIDDINAIFS
jgi:type II restriction enzyme